MHNKTEWSVSNDRVQINMPFAKVDTERRLVSGFATLDNVDKHGDVITSDASRKAFGAWRGNLREMHAPIAVGKVVEFREEEFLDANDGKTYKGIFVDAYVSKGAQDTWEKVLDGTLTGFSIGGKIIKRSTHIDEEYEVEYRQIDEYELVELSLVDSPANQLANVVSIQKSDTGPLFSGFAVETKTQNVMFCGDCATAVITTKDDFKCDAHGNMANIGWVEDTENKADAVKDLVMRFRKDSFQKSIDELIASGDKVDMSKFDSYLEPRVTVVKHQEGGAEMAENNENENVDTGHSDTDRHADVDQGKRRVETENAPAGTPTEIAEAGGVEEFQEAKEDAKEEANSDDDEEGTTKAASVSEVDTSDGVDLDRLTKAVADRVAEVVKSVKAESDEAVASAKTSFEDALAEMKKDIVSDLSGKIDNLGSRVSNLEDGTAVKKSADVVNNDDDGDEEENESLWRGTFLSANDFVS